MNTLAAMSAVNALLTLATNALLAASQASAIIQKAHEEGREVSDKELAELKAQSDGLTERAVGILNVAARG